MIPAQASTAPAHLDRSTLDDAMAARNARLEGMARAICDVFFPDMVWGEEAMPPVVREKCLQAAVRCELPSLLGLVEEAAAQRSPEERERERVLAQDREDRASGNLPRSMAPISDTPRSPNPPEPPPQIGPDARPDPNPLREVRDLPWPFYGYNTVVHPSGR